MHAGDPYGPTFSVGDVIGVGLLCDKREIFFCKNGEHLGIAFSDVSCSLYPTVSLHSPNEVCKGRRAYMLQHLLA